MSQITVANNYLGVLNPVSFQVIGDGQTDFTLANTATWLVRKPDGSEVTWSVGLANLTTTSATMVYNFQAGDIDSLNGTYEIQMSFSITGSAAPPIKVGSFDLLVTDPWGN